MTLSNERGKLRKSLTFEGKSTRSLVRVCSYGPSQRHNSNRHNCTGNISKSRTDWIASMGGNCICSSSVYCIIKIMGKFTSIPPRALLLITESLTHVATGILPVSRKISNCYYSFIILFCCFSHISFALLNQSLFIKILLPL